MIGMSRELAHDYWRYEHTCDRKLDTNGMYLHGVNPGKKTDQKDTSEIFKKDDQSVSHEG